MVIATEEIYATIPDFKFWEGSNRPRGVSENREGKDPQKRSWVEIRLNVFLWSTISQKHIPINEWYIQIFLFIAFEETMEMKVGIFLEVVVNMFGKSH